jgi:hypothetical protein
MTLQVAPGATAGVTLTTTAGVASGTAEIEQENNAAEADMVVGYHVYLPVVLRQQA